MLSTGIYYFNGLGLVSKIQQFLTIFAERFTSKVAIKLLPLQMYVVLSLALQSSPKKQEMKELKQLKRSYDPI